MPTAAVPIGPTRRLPVFGRDGYGRPRQIVGIDPAHPMAGGMRFAGVCIGGTTVLDYATGEIATGTTGTPLAKNYPFVGPALYANAGANYVTFANRSTVVDIRGTIAAVVYIPSLSVQGHYFQQSSNQTGWGLRNQASGSAGALVLLRNNTSITSTIDISASAYPYAIACSFDTVSGVVNFVSRNLATGVISTSVLGSATVTPSAPNGTYDYAYTGANSSNAAVSLAINTARYHTLSDLIGYVSDPWGIFLQPDNMLLSPARKVTAAAFLAAWAAQRNVVNGGVAT